MRLFLVLTLCFLCNLANAMECKTTRWPYSRQQSSRELRLLFDHIDRNALKRYLLYELTVKAQGGPYIANALSTYITHTEKAENERKFFELLAWGAELNSKTAPRKLDLKEVCQTYQKIRK